MKEKENILEPLWERAEDYGKISLELLKLQSVDKTSDVASTILPYAMVIVFTIIFLVFVNLGIAFWLGALWGSAYLGFFAVAVFYGLCGIIVHYFLHHKIKERIRNTIIQLLLK
jgi:phosphoglycerol transferase MdoB-like AlkP superfamily enzyme